MDSARRFTSFSRGRSGAGPIRALAAATALAAALVGCGILGGDDDKDEDSSSVNSGDCEEGEEGCECYPNKTCNDGLTCLSSLCVDTSDDGDDGSDDSDDGDGSDDSDDDDDGSDDSDDDDGSDDSDDDDDDDDDDDGSDDDSDDASDDSDDDSDDSDDGSDDSDDSGDDDANDDGSSDDSTDDGSSDDPTDDTGADDDDSDDSNPTDDVNDDSSSDDVADDTTTDDSSTDDSDDSASDDSTAVSCTETGMCTTGDRTECTLDGPVEAECAGCGVLECGVACCSHVSYFGAETYPAWVERPELVSGFTQTDSAVTLRMEFDDENQVGAISFLLDEAYAIDPYYVVIGLDARGDGLAGEVTVSLEDGDGVGGCQYPAYLATDDTIVLDDLDANCWEDFEVGSPVRQINVRIDSGSSGSAVLSVTSISWTP